MYWFQLNMYTFLRVLSFKGTTKRARKCINLKIYIFELNSPVHNLLVRLCTGLFLYKMRLQLIFKMRGCFCLLFFVFLRKLHFTFSHLKIFHKSKGNIDVSSQGIEAETKTLVLTSIEIFDMVFIPHYLKSLKKSHNFRICNNISFLINNGL